MLTNNDTVEEFEHGEFTDNNDFHNFFNFASPESQHLQTHLLPNASAHGSHHDSPVHDHGVHHSEQQDSHYLMEIMDDSVGGAAQHAVQERQLASNNVSIVNPNELFRSPMMDAQWSEENYTPLLSPRSSPLESRGVSGPVPPDFAMPASYFSPTASPVVECDPGLNRQAAGAIEAPSATARQQNRRRSKGNTPILGPSRVTKMSPLVRPSNSSSRRKSSTAQSNDNSSTGSSDSVSPEGMNEILMPPPRAPGQFPMSSDNALGSRRNSSSSNTATPHVSESPAAATPATPASLMNIGRKLLVGDVNQTEDKVRGAIRATTSASSSVASTPVLRPQLRRSSSTTNSAASSPHIIPNIKPKLPMWKSGPNSVGSSPVIMPKVSSPSVSPNILPKRASDVSDLSVLLASKSNYQNIVEGTHNQLGLSYPEHLSADLTSKKTSHKLAEQGRRNRINNALSDLAKLISPNGQSNSKANTVENAIVFIKDMQSEIAQLRQRLAQYEDVKREDNKSAR